MECRARMLNINLEHNQKLMKSCKRLYDYSYFIAEVNKNLDNGLLLAQAIRKAIDTCIEQNILKDILLKSKSEVVHMLLTEYDEKKHMKHIYTEGYENGRQEGYENGRQEGYDRVNRLYEILLCENREEDIKEALKNKDYLEKLFKEHNL